MAPGIIGILLTLGAPAAAEVDMNGPEAKLLLQYAETVGKVSACGDLEMPDRTEEMAGSLAEKNEPGWWAWLTGRQSDYAETLIVAADRSRMLAMASPCDIAPLQDGYRQLLRSIEMTLVGP